ncbi:MAG: hypothetical protein KatS3mg068_2661 [Candidatus Sericytochromatia bacterium]|nr:MAG: hypothetical protein KatS3mg068_2661 [Candidatus Sericytochromatia bacterium]
MNKEIFYELKEEEIKYLTYLEENYYKKYKKLLIKKY